MTNNCCLEYLLMLHAFFIFIAFLITLLVSFVLQTMRQDLCVSIRGEGDLKPSATVKVGETKDSCQTKFFVSLTQRPCL